MGAPRSWLSLIRKRFTKTSRRNISILHNPINDQSTITEAAREKGTNPKRKGSLETSSSTAAPPQWKWKQKTREDIAATKIQAVFRGHLARRAYRALKSLVKMQALVRGAYVRKQAQIALRCMHTLVRLQLKIRARQLLNRSRND